MNTFKEDVLFIQIVTKHILNFISHWKGDGGDEQNKDGKKRFSLHLVHCEEEGCQETKITKQTADIPAIQTVCDKYRQLALVRKSELCAKFDLYRTDQPFVRPSSHQEIVVDLYRCVTMIQVTELVCGHVENPSLISHDIGEISLSTFLSSFVAWKCLPFLKTASKLAISTLHRPHYLSVIQSVGLSILSSQFSKLFLQCPSMYV